MVWTVFLPRPTVFAWYITLRSRFAFCDSLAIALNHREVRCNRILHLKRRDETEYNILQAMKWSMTDRATSYRLVQSRSRWSVPNVASSESQRQRTKHLERENAS